MPITVDSKLLRNEYGQQLACIRTNYCDCCRILSFTCFISYVEIKCHIWIQCTEYSNSDEFWHILNADVAFGCPLFASEYCAFVAIQMNKCACIECLH